MGCICDVVRSKCPSTVVPIHSYKQKPPVLTQGQKVIIKSNWHILNTHLTTVGINTFICMFESRPELLETFKDFRGKELGDLRATDLLRKHSLRVMATIDKCVIYLDDPSHSIPSLIGIGMQHAKNEVPTEYVESILPPFLNTIKPYIEDHWCNELQLAWETFLSWILFYIKEGMIQFCDEKQS